MRRAALAAFAAVLATAVACGGDDAATTTETPGGLTPAGTKNETPTPPPGDGGGSGPPAPADPTLDEELTELASGEIEQVIEPGANLPLDTLQTAVTDTGSEPSCNNFAFDFTWQVQDPYPPDGVDLAWQFTRESGTVEVASGPAGEQTVGCGLLEAQNRSAAPIAVAIRYRIGAIE